MKGVPADKVLETMQKEMQRQVDIYNNMPKKSLGGISPNQALSGKGKKE